jgi:hypothetical protein
MWASGYRPWGRSRFEIADDLESGRYCFCKWANDTLPRPVIIVWAILFNWY